MKNKFIIIIFLSSLLSTNNTSCDVCLQPFNNFYLEDVWGNKYHKVHGEDGVFCETCSRLICKRITGGGFQFNDGRYMCNLCENNIVKGNETKLSSLDLVLTTLNEKGIVINKNQLEINLLNKNSLQELIAPYSNHSPETIKAITFIKKNTYIINILWGLNQLEFEGVLAHEILHAWIDNNRIKLYDSNLEGFCSLGTALIYNNSTSKLSKVLLKSLNSDNDPVYGKGYRHMNNILEKYGWSKLVNELLNNNYNW